MAAQKPVGSRAQQAKKGRKERALEKKIEKERCKEVVRRTEQERLQRETEEIARLKEEARIAKEAHDAYVKAEADRLERERESMIVFYERRKLEIIRIEAEAKEAQYWKRYLESSRLPHASSEAAINTYLDAMKEAFDEELDPLVQTFIDISTVAKGAEDICLTRESKGDVEGVKIYQSYMERLQELADWRFDQTTAHLLYKSYDLWKEGQENIFCSSADGWKVAFWINHQKNPRFRVLELPAVNVTLNLPKQFALANVAIRFLHRMADNLFKSRNSYMAIGGSFVIDVLGIPPPSKVVKNWILDQVLSSASTLIRVGYPIPQIGQPMPLPGAVLPIGVVLFLPPQIVHLKQSPQIGWWDEEEQLWETEGINDILYEQTSRKLSFQTTKAKTVAVIHDRMSQFPYLSWNIKPTSECGALMTLATPLMTFTIQIGIGWSKILSPKFPECKSFDEEELPPKVMLKRFSKCGIHLMPTDDDGVHLKTALKNAKTIQLGKLHSELFGLLNNFKFVWRVSGRKDGELERFVCSDATLASPGFSLASSKWNATLGQDVCVVRLLEIPDPVAPPTLEKSKLVKSLKYTIKGPALALLSEKTETYSEALLTEHHASLLLALKLKGEVQEESINKLMRGNAAYTECVKNLVYALRLFSFGP